MDNANLSSQNQNNEPLQGNSFVTTDIPDPEVARKDLAHKRIFFVLLALIVIVLGLIIWEIIDLAI